jgi:hypothetical protein
LSRINFFIRKGFGALLVEVGSLFQAVFLFLDFLQQVFHSLQSCIVLAIWHIVRHSFGKKKVVLLLTLFFFGV